MPPQNRCVLLCKRLGQCLNTHVLPDGGDHLWSWSLRFKSPQTEAIYVSDRASSLSFRAMLTSFVAGFWWHDFTDNFTDSTTGREARWVYNVFHVFAASVSFAICLLMTPCISRRWRYAQKVTEPAIVAWVALLGVMCHLDPDTVCGLLRSYQSEECLQPGVQTWDTFLVGCLIVAVSHCYLPLRTFWLFFIDVAVTMPATVKVMTLFFSRQNLMHMLTFIVFVAFALHGARLTDKFARRSFHLVLKEKSLRFETEFELEMVNKKVQEISRSSSDLDRPTDGASLSAASVAPTTTFTAALFQDASHPEAMNKLQALAAAENWLVRSEQLELEPDHLLGFGASGAVVKGTLCGMTVAVKVPASRMIDEKRNFDILNELRVLRKVRHPNIVIMHGACVLPGNFEVLLVLEYVEGMDMVRFVEQDGLRQLMGTAPTPQQEMTSSLEVLEGISTALLYLHGRKPAIVHGDLKPENIRTALHKREDVAIHVKVLDFGMARIKTQHAHYCAPGTYRWAAPELMPSGRRPQPSTAVDIFSFGRIMYYVATGVKPYAKMSGTAIRRRTMDSTIPSLNWSPATPLAECIEPVATVCMSNAAAERPRIDITNKRVCELKAELNLVGDNAHAGNGSDLADKVRLVQEQHEYRLYADFLQPLQAGPSSVLLSQELDGGTGGSLHVTDPALVVVENNETSEMSDGVQRSAARVQL